MTKDLNTSNMSPAEKRKQGIFTNRYNCVLKLYYYHSDTTTINELHNFIKGEETEIDFSKIIPFPKNKSELSDYELSNWQHENWGGFSNAWDVEMSLKTEEFLRIKFRTQGYTPPTKIIKKLGELFPNVNIRFVAISNFNSSCSPFVYYALKNANEKLIEKKWNAEKIKKDGWVWSLAYDIIDIDSDYQ
ncbi:MAG: hypothetical protein PHT69_02440 [Bacteroidales bacterium]|nr:hypothetical protein [Bacteroidales bacterium]